ncbi:MAG: hypothetical protein GY941_24050 [Planctomycetes bacterium]|nr:hypothetical protein [Planctomycetota bacterium]
MLLNITDIFLPTMYMVCDVQKMSEIEHDLEYKVVNIYISPTVKPMSELSHVYNMDRGVIPFKRL